MNLKAGIFSPVIGKQHILFALFALGLQYQVIIPFSDAGLRVCFGDVIAIIVSAILLFTLLRSPETQRWRAVGLLPALIGATLVMCLGLAIAWKTFGHPSSWALVNRFIGWFVLLCYLAAGIAVGSLWGEQGRRHFTYLLTISILILSTISSAIAFLFSWVTFIPVELKAIPLRGFVQNRNAFSFLLLVALTLLITNFRYSRPLFSHTATAIYLGLLALCLTYAGSRASIPLGICIVLIGWTWGRLPLRTIGVACVYGAMTMGLVAACRYGLWYLGIYDEPIPPLYIAHYSASPESDSIASNSSDFERLTSFIEAFNLWLQSPWVGTGLGSFLERHLALTGRPLIIHSTPLWIMTELGVVGLLAFGALAAVVLRGVWRRDASTEPALRLSALILLGAFGALSLVHDVMYQRIFWLVVGLALALPVATKPKPCAD